MQLVALYRDRVIEWTRRRAEGGKRMRSIKVNKGRGGARQCGSHTPRYSRHAAAAIHNSSLIIHSTIYISHIEDSQFTALTHTV